GDAIHQGQFLLPENGTALASHRLAEPALAHPADQLVADACAAHAGILRSSLNGLSQPRHVCYLCCVNFFVQRGELRDLYDKVAAGERISEADALRLFESKDLNALGAIADLARQKKVGNRASFIINRYLNYSNYCILSCQFCSFARKK